MNPSILKIGTLSLAGMVTTALFVVPLVGDNIAEKAVKRDDDAGAVVLASGDDDDDDTNDRFGARTGGTNTGTGGPTTGPGTDTGTGGPTTGPGTDTGTGDDGLDNSGPGNAHDGEARHGDRSGPSGPDNSGPGNADDPGTMDDNSGSGHSGGDDSGGGGNSGPG